MDIIDTDMLANTDDSPITPAVSNNHQDNFEITQEQLKELMRKMDSPIELMKEIAVKIKIFLDKQIESDLMERGRLSGDTRRWAKDYTELLGRIQQGLFGDKTINLHLHDTISHTQLAAKLRKYRDGDVLD